VTKKMGKKEREEFRNKLLARKEQLFLIDEALKRLQREEFGICQLCHQEIGRKRLEAVPWTPFCIDCQQKNEAESGA